jgi:type I restriction enzyme, S subunit
MAGEWRDTTLGEFVRLQRGHDLTEVERRPGQVPIMGSAGHNGLHDTAKATGPGVVIGRSGVGSMGVVTYCPTDYWPHNTVLYVTDFLGNDERFTYYFFHHLNLRRFDSGSAQASLNRNYIYPIRIRIPHPTEQRAIAHILGTLDDKIELNRRMNETLEAMAQALFKSWFVDFLPVRANMEARNRKARTQTGDPVRAKAERRDPGLAKPLADLFPDSFEDSELGEIPKGWGVGTLSDFASLNPESWSKETRPEVINYIDLSNVKWGSIDAVVGYRQQDAPSRAQRVLRSGDTIVGTVRPGNGSYAFINEDGFTGSTGFAVLRPHRSEYSQFIYLAATAAENIDALAHLADGGAYPAVRPDVVIATPVIRPRDKVFAQFSMFSDSLLARIAQNERESRTLAALRDTLLPKLISGELRVKDAERIVEIV